MRIVVCAGLAALCLNGQTPGGTAVQPGTANIQVLPGGIQVQPMGVQSGQQGSIVMNTKPVPDALVVATVGPERVTAGQLRELLNGAPAPVVNSARTEPRDFLAWTYLTKKAVAEAEKGGLDKKSPYADRLNWTRHQVLSMARIQEQTQNSALSEEQLKGWYTDNGYRFARFSVKLIYIAALPGKQAEADAKLQKVQQELKGGMEFGKAAKQYSDDQESAAKDGDFGTIEPDSKVSAEIRKALLKLKANEVSPPFKERTGYYLFLVTGRDQKPFDEVKATLSQQVQQEKMESWMKEQKDSSTVKILKPEFFQSLAEQELASRKDRVQVERPPVVSKEEIKPETALAEINGRPLTAAQYTGLMQGMPPQVRANAVVKPEEFLKQWAVMERLMESADKMKIADRQPSKNQLYYNRGQILLQAYVDDYLNNVVITAEQQKAGYEKDPERFRTATVRAIRVPYSPAPPPQTDPKAPKILNEAEGRARAEAAVAEIMGGLNFLQAVVKYAEDEELKSNGGLLPELSAGDDRTPPNIKQMIFGAKDGDVLGPVQMPNGFYIFKVEKVKTKTYEEVKDQVYEELRQQQFQTWFDKQRNSFDIKMVDAEAFNLIAHQTVR